MAVDRPRKFSYHYYDDDYYYYYFKYKGGYDRQSVQSAAGKLSCNKTALKRCTKTEIL